MAGSAEEITLFLAANQKEEVHAAPLKKAEERVHPPAPSANPDIDLEHNGSILNLLKGNEVAFIDPEGSTAKQVLENLLQRYPSNTDLGLDKKLQSVVRKYLNDCRGIGQKRSPNGQVKYILGGD